MIYHLSKTAKVEVFIEGFQRFQKIPESQNLWNFVILTSESKPGLKTEWKKYPICPKQLNLRYSQRDSKDSKKIPESQNLQNFMILPSESKPGPKIEWKKYPICPKWPKLRYSQSDSRDSKKFQNSWNFSIPITKSGSVTKIEWEKCHIL